MADMPYQTENIEYVKGLPDWGAIWAGVFTFIGIWVIFGLLGLAIFAGVANPNTASPMLGMNVGMGIWSIILTVIAMYVAGLETAHLAGVRNRRDGVIHGMVMFGLCVVAALVITVMAGNSLSGGEGVGAVRSPYLLTLFSNLGWIGFLSLFLGWLAAMGGASQGVVQKSTGIPVREVRRPAA